MKKDAGALERAERYAHDAVAPAGGGAAFERLGRVVRGVWERAEEADVGVEAYITRPRGGA